MENRPSRLLEPILYPSLRAAMEAIRQQGEEYKFYDVRIHGVDEGDPFLTQEQQAAIIAFLAQEEAAGGRTG